MSQREGSGAEGHLSGDPELDAVLRDLARAPDLPLVDPRIGARLGPYVLEARIGTGAMGTVYRARDERLERHVAIKVVPPAEAFEEGRHAARTAHPNIARVYDVGSTADCSWIAFELIDGETVARWLGRATPTEAEVLSLARGLAEALQHLHDRDLIHGDLSPRNVLWRDGAPILIDFGLASEPGTPRRAGTAGFMAPEVAKGEARDARADVFAFGAMLATLPTLPAALSALATECTARDPGARPANGAALVARLAAMGPRPAARRWLPAVLLVLGVVVVALAIAALGRGGTTEEPRPAADRARPSVEPSPGPAPTISLQQLTFHSRDDELRDAAVSPDGAHVALIDVDGLSFLRVADGRRAHRSLPSPPRSLGWLSSDRLLVRLDDHLVEVRRDSGALTLDPQPPELRRIAIGEHELEVWAHGALAALGSGEARLSLPSAGWPVAVALSEDESQVAWIAFHSDGSKSLHVGDLDSGEVVDLVASSRLMSDFSGTGLAWSGSRALVVALASVPAQGLSAEIVRTPGDRWSPRRLVALEREASMLSLDDVGHAVVGQSELQSDTMLMSADGGPRRISRSTRDDRPTSWTRSGGLVGMMRVGATHQTVRIPIEGGHPEPIEPRGWHTWGRQTTHGLVTFRPTPEADTVVLELHAEGGPRTLATLPETVGTAGVGRAVPRRWAVGCSADGRCALVGGPDRVRVAVIDVERGERRELGALGDGAAPPFDIAVDGSFSRALVASADGLWMVELATGEVQRLPGAPGFVVHQYVAADPRGGWYLSGISSEAPRYRILHLRGESFREVYAHDRAWLAHPTPAPEGGRLAFSAARQRSDLFRFALPK